MLPGREFACDAADITYPAHHKQRGFDNLVCEIQAEFVDLAYPTRG